MKYATLVLGLCLVLALPAWAAEPRIGQLDHFSGVEIACPSEEDADNYDMLFINNPRLYIDGPELRAFRDAHGCKILGSGQEVRIQRIKRPSKFRGICVQVIGPNLSAAGIVTPEEKAACYWILPAALESSRLRSK